MVVNSPKKKRTASAVLFVPCFYFSELRRKTGQNFSVGVGEENVRFEGRCFALNRPYFASLSNSVRYFGANSIAFLMNAASCAASTLGGGVVRVATGIPTSLKNSSWPAGEQMQSILTGFDEAFWNW
jgi:hypothetical protein